jgi:ubiquinone/menaquinone biosynthesis C-methylase UbiE
VISKNRAAKAGSLAVLFISMDHPSQIVPTQQHYWDSLADEKHFSHPLNTSWLMRYVRPKARILDFGCGYGRILSELQTSGYTNMIGIDFSVRMLKHCRSRIPDVNLVQNDGQSIPLQSRSVDLVLLFAVLTCIPQGGEQRDLLQEINRVLRPGALVYISDLFLNHDLRNVERYDRYADQYGTYGVFKLPEGVIVRHHTREWIEELTTSFRRVECEDFEVTTMNRNKSAAFQYLGRSVP